MLYIIGAGPGDPDLITVKGAKLLGRADVLVYAGSLVNPALLKMVKPTCELYDSSSMTLDEVIVVIQKSTLQGKEVVRLHSGDPSIYGAIREQVDKFKALSIPFEVVPGVSSFCAAAAVLNAEYTLPGVSQTVILTRLEGRTSVPRDESLSRLAAHRASMAIFLSVDKIDAVVDNLLAGYEVNTPVAVVYKATWDDQVIITGTLLDIAGKIKKANVTRTALILVGGFLGDEYELSRLYNPEFSHMYRQAKA